MNIARPIPVTARAKAWVCGLLGLRVRIAPGPWMSVSCECFVLSVRGLCDGLITRPEKSSQMCACVCVCVCLFVFECDEVQQETFTLTMIR